MSYTIVSDICEGIGDCIAVCPEECIHWAEECRNAKGTGYVYIDESKCTDCDACLAVCPIYGAVLAEWKPELQRRYTFPYVAWRQDI
jgi:NAD-dependent dihydropyrimidine dehydrogenase PreA subunit